jgi:nucleotide-binding universal stress UspA family protein
VRRFDTLVTALDLYPAADRVLSHVAALAMAGSLPVELVTVLAAGADASDMSATAALQRRATRCALRRHELFVVRNDSPGAVIVDHVSGRDGALLVLATTARGGDDGDRLGLVTDAVMSRARQPVVVVGPRAEPSAGCLLVAVDAADGADAALPVVERWLATFRYVDGPRIIQVAAPDSWPDQGDEPPDHAVGRYLEQLGATGIAATGAVVRGHDPVSAILDHAARSRAAMIVVTAPADPGRPTHWFRTSRRLIRLAPCPVLVVPADCQIGRVRRSGQR